ncbi:undecaprenyl-diphosphate phosphatase [Leptospira bandrabouensis]|uniref:undecaprenyl-diphosphate phosphatase n=1 Tax=Leptospira bandrabouensis TaxID=2484903 RepID=UPI001EE7D80F|nr:undecaprenyl-diphosphate phosphatase [Leptospira bandrabouensis]MCG6144731.1 undecaprenyl-diphosphate phosphatase [Leptospira bandrabouensis]MCG6161637.1 undecaprenyl-diphosphate phosphatase [Leptospira bandrabouensis]MCG6164564.1 undecaprenyl-diphosphate phosphatase [Leptospira bandrabouensis]
MDNTLNAFLRGIIEAATEFLPVSSTGHLFLFSYFFPFKNLTVDHEAFEDLFDIFIQTGAILSVVVLYFQVLWKHTKSASLYLFKKSSDHSGFHFYRNLTVGILPILILGFVFKNSLDQIKMRPDLLLILGLSWFVGGLVMVFVEIKHYDEGDGKIIGIKESIIVGFLQCFALIPGVSRSAATIITARTLGVSKKDSAEFSFFLAIPVLTLAGVYKLYKHRAILNSETIGLLLFGSIVSFVICYFIIRLFMAFIRRRSFLSFGIYRILLGILVILYFVRG